MMHSMRRVVGAWTAILTLGVSACVVAKDASSQKEPLRECTVKSADLTGDWKVLLECPSGLAFCANGCPAEFMAAYNASSQKHGGEGGSMGTDGDCIVSGPSQLSCTFPAGKAVHEFAKRRDTAVREHAESTFHVAQLGGKPEVEVWLYASPEVRHGVHAWGQFAPVSFPRPLAAETSQRIESALASVQPSAPDPGAECVNKCFRLRNSCDAQCPNMGLQYLAQAQKCKADCCKEQCGMATNSATNGGQKFSGNVTGPMGMRSLVLEVGPGSHTIQVTGTNKIGCVISVGSVGEGYKQILAKDGGDSETCNLSFTAKAHLVLNFEVWRGQGVGSDVHFEGLLISSPAQ